MKTISQRVEILDIDGTAYQLEVSIDVGANYHEECGVCTASLNEISKRIRDLSGARFLMKSDRHLVDDGNYILVDRRVDDIPRFFAVMIQKSMSQLIELSDVTKIKVTDSNDVTHEVEL